MTRSTPTRFAITGGRVIDPAQRIDRLADVLVSHGAIEAVDAPGAFDSAELDTTLDVAGKVVAPGFIDLHTHLRTPGEEWKEDFASGASAAARGGFTTICAMPNTNPAVDNPEVLAANVELARRDSVVRVEHIAAITVERAGKQLSPIVSLVDGGAVAFSDDGDPLQSSNMMRQALTYAHDLLIPIINHAEDRSLVSEWDMNEGAVSARLGLMGQPTAAEVAMIARDIELARMTGGRLHIPHVSASDSVELIRNAKNDGLRVTAEVTPHHIALTEDWVYGEHGNTPATVTASAYDTNAKMAPPLRHNSDVEELYEGLKEGVIDAIATDHAPHAETDKQCTFSEAANGIIGMETAFALAASVCDGDLPMIIERLTTGPARAMGFWNSGSLKVGKPADIAIIDPEAHWKVSTEALGSKSANTPLLDMTLRGRVVQTFVGGIRVWNVVEDCADVG